jgi:hypothetical protein
MAGRFRLCRASATIIWRRPLTLVQPDDAQGKALSRAQSAILRSIGASRAAWDDSFLSQLERTKRDHLTAGHGLRNASFQNALERITLSQFSGEASQIATYAVAALSEHGSKGTKSAEDLLQPAFEARCGELLGHALAALKSAGVPGDVISGRCASIDDHMGESREKARVRVAQEIARLNADAVRDANTRRYARLALYVSWLSAALSALAMFIAQRSN